MRLFDQPHHDGSPVYVGSQNPSLGETVTVWVRVPTAANVDAVHVRTVADGEPASAAARVDSERTGRSIGGYGRDDVWWRSTVALRNPLTRYRFVRAARFRGLSVPDDVSVIGYDDAPLVAFTDPPLTTLRQPVREMSVAAVRALVDEINGQAAPHSEYVFRPELVVRGSTGAVRA